MTQYLWIALGSSLGGIARFALSGLIAHRFGDTFPWGTLFINVSGSFVIGFFATLTDPGGRIIVGGAMRQFVMTGLLGGYTTYSSFSLQTFALVREGEWLRAGANSLSTFAICFLAVWLGHLCAAWLNTLKGS